MHELGTLLTAKKNHACGGKVWKVIRNGADYKLQCTTCGRIILVDMTQLEKQFRVK